MDLELYLKKENIKNKVLKKKILKSKFKGKNIEGEAKIGMCKIYDVPLGQKIERHISSKCGWRKKDPSLKIGVHEREKERFLKKIFEFEI